MSGLVRRQCLRDIRGNALLEVILIPLVLLPVAGVIVRAWTIQQSELVLSEAARTLGRAAALAAPLSKEQYRALAGAALADAEMAGSTELIVRAVRGGYVIVLRRRVDSLVPGLSWTVERSVRVG